MENQNNENDGNNIYLGDLLAQRIADNLESLEAFDPASDEYAAVVKATTELMKQYTEFIKVECEFNDRAQQSEFEEHMKQIELANQRAIELTKTGMNSATELMKCGAALAVFAGMYRTNLMCEFTQDKFVLNPLFRGLPTQVLKSVKLG